MEKRYDPGQAAQVLRRQSRGRTNVEFGYMPPTPGMMPMEIGYIPSDVDGSYTGTGAEDDIPVQDADDL